MSKKVPLECAEETDGVCCPYCEHLFTVVDFPLPTEYTAMECPNCGEGFEVYVSYIYTTYPIESDDSEVTE